MFNPQLYLLAYGRIYSNQGAMTPGVTEETVVGMSVGKIDRIIDAMRHERYRFSPARRTYIPKKNGKMRPLGMPTWSDKLVGEVVRLLLEAYYEPTFPIACRTPALPGAQAAAMLGQPRSQAQGGSGGHVECGTIGHHGGSLAKVCSWSNVIFNPRPHAFAATR
jgi:hypothetical protein